MIITCVNLEPFLLAINLDVVSSFNIFNNLIYVLRFIDITGSMKYHFSLQKKNKKS